MKVKNRKYNHQSLEGMTLVEIMIVVIIMAIIATGVSVAVLPQFEKAKIKSTRTDAQAVRAAVTMYLADNASGDCPTTEDLVEGSYLDKSKKTVDAWDRDFAIECDGGEVTVTSAGPDGEMGTEDDIS